MDELREQFEQEIEQLNEKTGRGRGIRSFGGVKTGFKDAVAKLNFDVLNRATPFINPNKEEKYNFNNYYSLDVRVNIDKLIKTWEAGTNDYNRVFDGLYGKEPYDENLKQKLRMEYEKYYMNEDRKAKMKGKTISGDIVPHHLDNDLWKQDIDSIVDIDLIAYIYDEIPVISIFSHNTEEKLAIKQEGFVGLIMDAMTSAVRGHIPQGVTIEELLQGKFSRKAIAPEQGAFINRVKDPTSDKDFDFRSWKSETLVELHNLIMTVFRRDQSLNKPLPELNEIGVMSTTRGKLFLYLDQEDFHALEKGGEGIGKIAKGALQTASDIAETPDF